VSSPEEKEEKKNRKGDALRRRRQERQLYDEMVVKTFLLGHIKDPYKEKLRDAIKKRVDSYSKSIVKASSGLMHLEREMYRDVTPIETVEIPHVFFDKIFIRQLTLGTEEARKENERVDVFHEKHPFYSLNGTRYKGDRDIYTYRPMKYITNLKNHLTVNLERFMRRAVIALYSGISRNGKWAIINGIMKDRKREDEVEFVDKTTSKVSTNEASTIRAVIQEDRAGLGLVNPTDKILALKKEKERYYRLVLRYFVFLDRDIERKAEVMLSEETNEEWERRKAFLMGKRFNVVPLGNIKSHFVTIDSRILHGVMREISPEFDFSREDFTGENRETYWVSIFDFKRLKVSKKKVFIGLIETDGVALCIRYWRLKKDRPVPPLAALVTKHEEKKEADPVMQEVQDNDLIVDAAKHEENKGAGPATQEVEDNDFIVDVTKHGDEKDADPATQKVQDNDLVVDATKHEENNKAGSEKQKVQDNDFIVGADPGNTNIIAVAAPKRAEDGTDGNLRQKDMRLLRFSRARYYRESAIMNARKEIETWNSGMKDHLEALSEVTSRGADFEAFRKSMGVRVAHWDALWEEYTKPRWARLCMHLYGGRQRAFANFFNQLSALKENENQRLVVAYGAGRWKTLKGTTPAPTTRAYKECARRLFTIPVDEFRTSYTHHELGCTLRRVGMEKCQRNPEEIAKYGPLTEEQMERRAKVRGLLALVSTTSDSKKRMEFVNRDFNAAINIRKCAVLEKRPPESTRENFIG